MIGSPYKQRIEGVSKHGRHLGIEACTARRRSGRPWSDPPSSWALTGATKQYELPGTVPSDARLSALCARCEKMFMPAMSCVPIAACNGQHIVLTRDHSQMPHKMAPQMVERPVAASNGWRLTANMTEA